MEAEPTLFKEKKTVAPVKDQTVLLDLQSKKNRKEKPKEPVQLQGDPLIDDIIQKVEKVESTLPAQMSQHHHSILLQLKKAI